MQLRTSLLIAFLFTSTASGESLRAASSLREIVRSPKGAVEIEMVSGRLLDAEGLNLDYGVEPLSAARRLIAEEQQMLFGNEPANPDLRLVETRHSLTGTHLRFRQYYGDLEVEGGDFVVSFDARQRLTAVHNRVVSVPDRIQPAIDERQAIERLYAHTKSRRSEVVLETRLLLLSEVGSSRLVYRIVGGRASAPWADYVDAIDGTVIKSEALYFNSAGRLFTANPVTVLNDPSLHDRDNSASAVPESAYSIRELVDVGPSGRLVGPNVEIVDIDAPFTTPADSATAAQLNRESIGFEEVMAYDHLDRSQRYLQSLGFTGQTRVINRALRVDAHALSGADDSHYAFSIPGEGNLYFGDGGVDDAEDPDILLHEYGHAIHDAISPGNFGGEFTGESRAIAEGFGDYWAFSSGYADSLKSGRDPFCIGDWDARCAGNVNPGCFYPPGSDCLRRVDSRKTMDDFIRSGPSGIEHSNAEIWSSALREIFLAIVAEQGVDEGRRTTDRLVVESFFGIAASPSFSTMARRLLDTDRVLYQGDHVATLCGAMTSRKILTSVGCGTTLRGELTFFQSPDRDLSIPDASSLGISSTRTVTDPRLIERVQVRVDVSHPHRGDLKITLTAPNGTTVVLKQPTAEIGRDVHATYGLDANPSESLGIFSGIPAAGEWRLNVADVASRDVGSLTSWALLIDFQNEEPLTVRTRAISDSIFLPAIANTPGAAGTKFVSDVRIFNSGTSEARVTLFFTQSGEDGRNDFSSVQLRILPQQTAVLNDIVGSFFQASGSGSVEVRGDVEHLIVSARTFNDAVSGTFGQRVPAVRMSAAAGAGTILHIPHLRNTTEFRSSVGVAELEGEEGVIELTVFDSTGKPLETRSETLLPFGHFQIPVLGGTEGTLADAVRVELRVVTGQARIAAYGSVVDNLSGDGVYVPARVRDSDSSPRVIPVVTRGEGAAGTRWRSDLLLASTSLLEEQLTLSFRPADGGAEETRTVRLDPGASIIIPDLISTLFQREAGTGQLLVSGARLAFVFVASRTWTPGTVGSYGQLVPSQPVLSAIGRGSSPSNAIQLESSASFRTNIGITEVRGEKVKVLVRLFDASGTQIFQREVELGGRQFTQFSLGGSGAPPFSGGRIVVEVTEGDGQIFAYASVVDNRTGDPIYIPAEIR